MSPRSTDYPFSIEEAAIYAGVPESEISDAIQRGDLRTKTFRGVPERRIPRQAIASWRQARYAAEIDARVAAGATRVEVLVELLREFTEAEIMAEVGRRFERATPEQQTAMTNSAREKGLNLEACRETWRQMTGRGHTS